VILQLSSAAEVALLACSGIALPRESALRPLGPKGWAALSKRTEAAGLALEELLSMDAGDLRERLALDVEQSERLTSLFARRGQLAMELERLSRLGIWTITDGDERYPRLLVERLGDLAPPVLFGLGDLGLFERDDLAVAGSRDATEEALEAARRAGEAAAEQGWALVSGAARGVDAAAMRGASEAGGSVVGVPADGLERHLRDATVRAAAADGRVVYVSPYRPDAPFSVGAAMGRNKLIYCLARVALVVQASAGSGGTWAGAVEALEHGWLPVYAREGATGGNGDLVRLGARPVGLDALGDLARLAAEQAAPDNELRHSRTVQQTLF
jgi:predicted Rossmann fold nucleotide-binding protein DprA/Smf involved in DNA uptake